MTDDLMHLADSLGFTTPARQVHIASAVDFVSTPGGPAQLPLSGRGRTSGLDQVAPRLVGSGGVVDAAADVDVPAVRARDEGRAAGADGAATFTLPPTPELPRFLTAAELVKAVRRAP